MTVTQSARAKSGGSIALLASRRFGPLFATQFLSAFNDNALRNALVLMIAYRADATAQLSAQMLIPLAAGLFILPFFLQAAFFGPLKYAILPDLLAPDELLLGNALVEASTFLAILLGTIAGVLIASRHGAAVIAALIVLVALAAWAASLLIPHTSPAAARSPTRWNLIAATMRVIAEAAGEPIPFRTILGISWFWLAGAVYLSQFPGYVRFVVGGEEAVVTLFLTVFAIGIAVGSLLCNRLLAGKLSARTVPWGALGIGLFSIDFWLASPAPGGAGAPIPLGAFLGSPAHWHILADLFGIAVSGGVFVVPLYALLQAATERGRRAQAIAANNIINAAAMVAASVATIALIAAGVSIAGLFLLTGCATLLVALLFRRVLPGFAAFPPPR